jgi:hypothetical protein
MLNVNPMKIVLQKHLTSVIIMAINIMREIKGELNGREAKIMTRTIEVSVSVEQLLKYRDEGAEFYWNPDYDMTLWSGSDRDPKSVDVRVAGYLDFVAASGHETLEALSGDQEITARVEIPDRGPGRPRQRTEPVERSTIDLPTSLWQALDEARGDKSRRAFIDSAVRRRIEQVSSVEASAQAVMASFDSALKVAMEYEAQGGTWDREDAQQEFALLAEWLDAHMVHHE